MSQDTDAKVGHIRLQTLPSLDIKLIMTEERIITAAVVTSGEKHDGKPPASCISGKRIFQRKI